MFCTNCGEKIKEDVKFCQKCGKEVIKSGARSSTKTQKTLTESKIDRNTPPYPYVISTEKLLIMSVLTLGLFDIYWFYRHFKSFSSENEWRITAWVRAIFYPLTSYTLFRELNISVRKVDPAKGVSTVMVPILLFIINMLWKLPDPFWLITFASVLFLVPAQNTINFYWREKFGDKVEQAKFGGWNIAYSIIGGIFLILALIGTFFPERHDFSPLSDPELLNESGLLDDSDAVREGFMQGCDTDGSMSTYCSCMYDELSAEYSVAEIIKMGAEYEDTDEVPQAMIDAADYCIDEL